MTRQNPGNDVVQNKCMVWEQTWGNLWVKLDPRIITKSIHKISTGAKLPMHTVQIE